MIDDRLIIQLDAEASPQLREVAVRYWNRVEEGSPESFSEAVSDIARHAGLSPVSLLEELRRRSVVTLENTTCESCKEPLQVDCRAEFIKRLKNPVCYACFSAGYRRRTLGAPARASDKPSTFAPEEDADEHGGQTSPELHAAPSVAAAPIKVFADQVIALEDFQKNPAEAMAACSGDSLIVMSDNKPLFYCVSPELMQSVQSPG